MFVRLIRLSVFVVGDASLLPNDGVRGFLVFEGKVLFLCSGDAARIQMAEGFFLHQCPDELALYTLYGPEREIHPETVLVMKEVGIDILNQRRPRSVAELGSQRVTYAITICACSREPCLAIRGSFRPVKWRIEDPTACVGSAQRRQKAFRQTRDDIATRIAELLARLSWRRRRHHREVLSG